MFDSELSLEECQPIRERYEPTDADRLEAYLYLNDIQYIPDYMVEASLVYMRHGLVNHAVESATFGYWQDIENQIASWDSSPL